MASEQTVQLREIIHKHLKQQHVYTAVRTFVKDYIAEEGGAKVEEDKLLAALHEKKIIDEVIASLGGLNLPPPNVTNISTAAQPAIKNGMRYLHLRILRGKSFVGQISPEGGAGTISVSVLFNGQRHRTNRVPASTDPTFEQAFLFELPQVREVREMMKRMQHSPIHIVVIAHGKDGSVDLIGSHSLEWRKVLLSGVAALTIELGGSAAETVASGLLEVNLEVIPRSGSQGGVSGADEGALLAIIKTEKESSADADRCFFSYAKAWWREYVQIRPEHNNRHIKLFALTESGLNRAVTSFVQKLEAGRLLRSAGEAARFVSLLKLQKDSMPSFSRGEVWSEMHTFLAKGGGAGEEHALLLCSLLLGFDLDAFVVAGTTSAGVAHMWVMTLSGAEDGSHSRIPSVTFWEPLTAARFNHTGDGKAQSSHRYGHVYAVFNDRFFYGNIQPSDDVSDCTFDLWNSARWKAMSDEILSAIPKQGYVPLIAPTINIYRAEEAIETGLTSLIAAHRRSLGLTFEWDSHLSYLLSPALVAYESERVTGVTHGNIEFQQSIKRAIPELHTFKAFPIPFNHSDPSVIFDSLLSFPVAADILSVGGGVDLTRFGLRAQVFAYPESVVVVWVMLAVIYQSLE